MMTVIGWINPAIELHRAKFLLLPSAVLYQICRSLNYKYITVYIACAVLICFDFCLSGGKPHKWRQAHKVSAWFCFDFCPGFIENFSRIRIVNYPQLTCLLHCPCHKHGSFNDAGCKPNLPVGPWINMEAEWQTHNLKKNAEVPYIPRSHGDVIKCKHIPCYWPLVWGIHLWPVKSLHKGQWRAALMFSLISAWTNGSVNNRYAGHLRRHRALYGVTVMIHMVQSLLELIMVVYWSIVPISMIILGMSPANERRRYYVAPFLIGRAHTQNDSCMSFGFSSVTLEQSQGWSKECG